MQLKSLLAVLLITTQAAAQTPPITTIPPGDDKILVIHKSDSAPIDGQLFSNDTALRWGFWLQQYKYRLKADVEQAQHVCAVETTYKDKVLGIEKTRSATVEKDLLVRLERAEKARLSAEEELRNPHWYKTRDFGIFLGLASSAGILGLSIWALEARK
jgi:hypothetical protein